MRIARYCRTGGGVVEFTEEQDRFWWSRGWTVQRAVFDGDELAAIDEATREVEGWGTAQGLAHYEQTPHGPVIARSEYFEPYQAVLRERLRRGPIPDGVDHLLGEPGVLFKEKINYKHPGGGGFAPHQDLTAYPQITRCISVMAPLDPASTDNGCLWFATQRPGRVLDHERGVIVDPWCDTAQWVPVEVEPGDLVFFDGLAPHRSGTNTSDRSRRAMYLTYNPAGEGDHRGSYYADKRRRLDAAGGVGQSGNLLISFNDDFLGRPVATESTQPGTP